MTQALQALVRHIISDPRRTSWTLQGFGMLRCYLDDQKIWRLNIWNKKFAVPNVSEIHDHPWHFASTIIAGEIINTKFAEFVELANRGEKYNHVQIITGIGGGTISEVDQVKLAVMSVAKYKAGEQYGQRAEEIHCTEAINGTITLNKRKFRRETSNANVFWKEGPWVSALPREATVDEIKEITASALERLEAEQ